KSLFEEQIQLENLELSDQLGEYDERHAEMTSLFPNIEHAGPQEFLHNLKKAKDAISIPLFASLNAVYKESWVEYAQLLEETGVDGLELNLYSIPKDTGISGSKIIEDQLEILKAIKKVVTIPVSVKLSPYYTNPLNIIKKMDDIGVNAFVLFNKLFQPDIDIDQETNFFPYNLSMQQDNRLPLRFAGLLYDNVKAQICSNTGIFTGEDVIAMLLAGADTVQVVSTLYKNQVTQIEIILNDIVQWMESKHYKTLDDFRGKLSRKNTKDPFAYKRAQYVDILLHSDNIFKKFPMR
ncbi:MAG: dihydroorotate dehydrogenase, partial [Bacteroidales bacterium]|nr:dihydroorotate dehydrogenase [Bacteroidales bacterium]